jgi:hypothetical protein
MEMCVACASKLRSMCVLVSVAACAC